MTRPVDAPSGLFRGILVALVLVAPFWGAVAAWWLLSQPLAWWFVS